MHLDGHLQGYEAETATKGNFPNNQFFPCCVLNSLMRGKLALFRKLDKSYCLSENETFSYAVKDLVL